MTIKISAIICTHNRAQYLKKTIQSLITQTLPKDQYEIIVVDNASEDKTKQVCTEYASHLRYIYEPKLGLSQARNAGWKAANGKYVAYLDDDAVASPDWLQKIVEAFKSITPQPGALGGKVEPIWEGPKPAWLSDKLLGQLALLDWGPGRLTLNEKQWFVGANMAYPKHILEEVDGFKTFLGRKGNNLLSMEENLLRKEIERRGYKCFYDPQIVIKHHILPSRLTKKWFMERAYWNGVSSALVDTRLSPPNILSRIGKGITTILRILLSPRELFCLIFPTNNPDSFAIKCSIFARLGHIAALWGLAR